MEVKDFPSLEPTAATGGQSASKPPSPGETLIEDPVKLAFGQRIFSDVSDILRRQHLVDAVDELCRSSMQGLSTNDSPAPQSPASLMSDFQLDELLQANGTSLEKVKSTALYRPFNEIIEKVAAEKRPVIAKIKGQAAKN